MISFFENEKIKKEIVIEFLQKRIRNISIERMKKITELSEYRKQRLELSEIIISTLIFQIDNDYIIYKEQFYNWLGEYFKKFMRTSQEELSLKILINLKNAFINHDPENGKCIKTKERSLFRGTVDNKNKWHCGNCEGV